MDAFVLIAVIAVVLMLAELLLPTGGVLAGLGAIGLIVAGVVALTADADTAATEYIGPALITLGVLSGVTFYFVTRKVLEAHRETHGADRLGGDGRLGGRGPQHPRPRGPGLVRRGRCGRRGWPAARPRRGQGIES